MDHTTFGQVTLLSEGQQTVAVIEGHSHTISVVRQSGDDSNGDKFAILTVSYGSVENPTLEGSGIEVSVRLSGHNECKEH